MGAYVNPIGMVKELWLQREGTRIDFPPPFKDIPDNKFLIVLLSNHTFSSAGVAYSQEDYCDMTGPDKRPRSYYLVDKSKVYANSNLEQFLPFKPDHL